MFYKAPLLLVGLLYLQLSGPLAPPVSAIVAPAPIVDISQLHLPQTPFEWGVFVATAIAFLFIRRSDKRVIQRTVRSHVRSALASALAADPAAGTPPRSLFNVGTVVVGAGAPPVPVVDTPSAQAYTPSAQDVTAS